MEANRPEGVFLEQLKKLINDFGAERNRHKSRGLALKLSTAALAAAATVLLGWQDAGTLAPWLKNLALVANALITLLAAYEAFFEPKKLWVRETVVLNQLKDVRREFEVEAAKGTIPAELLQQYVGRVTGILSTSLESWRKDKAAGAA